MNMPAPAMIALIVFDVDGVLTDGAIILDDTGRESKRFHVRDGFAITAAMKAGLEVGVITGRASRVVTLRMAELGIQLYRQGCSRKGEALEYLAAQAGVDMKQIAYLGDDLVDLPAMRACGYPMAVADAAAEVRADAKYITQAKGGQGAAREAIEHILKAQGRWDQVVERFAR